MQKNSVGLPRVFRSFKVRLFCVIVLVGLFITLLLREGILLAYNDSLRKLVTAGSLAEADFLKLSEEAARQANIYAIVVMAVCVALAALLALLSLRPFEEVVNQMRASASYEEASVPKATYLETEGMVEAFRTMQDRLSQVETSRQEFVSNVSHELKTPLTSMKVLADSLLIQENAPVELYREFMGDIAGEIDRETKTIDDLMRLARMEEGAGSLHTEPTDLEKLAEDVIKQLKYIARDKDIDLILESNRKVTAEIDSIKMAQVFMNLIENGIKYNKQKGYVKTSLDANHVNAIITVEDSGLGIPEKDIDRVFERFYRGDKSHSTTIEGSGLGLAITKKIVLLHKGSIKVTSVVGEGTTFTVTLPLKNAGVLER
ncbi:MAG: HAMP domain-containing histidine kinase [Lachnospiraceae bacterium]|nr:HAMP domain-containing histidine kinase [Lachnospiraceae bacterium]